MKKGWYLGIDFGTSNTYIVGYYYMGNGNGGKFYATELMPEDLLDGDKGIPTVIAAEKILGNDLKENNSDNLFYVGKQALRHPMLPIVRDQLKSNARLFDPHSEIGSATEEIDLGTGECQYKLSVEEALVKFFAFIFDEKRRNEKAGKQRGLEAEITKDTIQSIVIGCPNTDDNNKTQSAIDNNGRIVLYGTLLVDVLAKCFEAGKILELNQNNSKSMEVREWKKVQVVPESELAGITYLYSCQKADDVVLVVDSGGGTTDFALLYWKEENGRYTLHSQCIGGECNYAGSSIDESIQQSIQRIGNYPTKVACMRAKEDLFKDTEDEYKSKSEKDLRGEKSSVSGIQGLQIGYDANVAERMYLTDEKNPSLKEPINETKVYNSIIEQLKSGLDQIKAEGNGINWEINSTKNSSGRKKRITLKHKINKVFFMGGTSYIAPFREEIMAFVKGYNESKKEEIFDEDLKALTTFDNGIRIHLDGEQEVGINCFNAVALGACIKALGKELVSFPKVEFVWESEKAHDRWIEIYSPEKRKLAVLSQEIQFKSIKMRKEREIKYVRNKKNIAFCVRANNDPEKEKKIIVPCSELNPQEQNPLIIQFSLSEEYDLICTVRYKGAKGLKPIHYETINLIGGDLYEK